MKSNVTGPCTVSRIAKISVLLLFSDVAWANGIPVRHLVGWNENPYSLMTGGICPYVYSTGTGALCSLSQETGESGSRIDTDTIAKFDAQAYDDFNRLSSKPTNELVQRIFADQKFNSASGIVTLSSYFKNSSISFSPLRLVQTYLINNPVFPEVHYASATDSVFRIQHVFQIDVDPLGESNRKAHFYFGLMPWIAQLSRTYLDADLSDVLAQSKNQKKTSSTHADMNLVGRYVPGLPWFRGVTLQFINLNGSEKCKPCTEHLLDIDIDGRPRWHVSADFGGSFPVGAFIVGAGLERQVEDGASRPAKLNLTAVYKLTSFGFYASFDENISRMSFLYEGDFYKSGIVYTNEKQVNALRFERKNEALLVLGATL